MARDGETANRNKAVQDCKQANGDKTTKVGARKVFLVGFMGCGKSSFGRRAATQLEWDFVDTDKEVERRAEMTIPEIFALHGEGWFRELEARVVREAAGVFGKRVGGGFGDGDKRGRAEIEDEVTGERNEAAGGNTVVAPGGGAVCSPGVMEMIREAGAETVYLKMSPERLVARIGEKGRAKRPKIAGMNDAELLAYIEKTLPEREKYYNKATFVLDCNEIADSQIVGRLLQHIESQNIKN